jgi:exosortase A-associated hydrolase 1
MRRWLSFGCAGETLAAALDEAAADAGLLIVSGGNETLSGSHGNMAAIAARVSAAGYPVFRYDRRGVGDSSGSNGGFEAAADDLAAAVLAFRSASPGMKRIVGFGNCDGATTLALFHDNALDALVLANPWVIEALGEMPPAAAIKARYKDKLRDPKEWLRLLRGGVNIGKLLKGLRSVAAKPSTGGLADRVRGAIAGCPVPARVVLARGDATALAFADAWGGTKAANVTTLTIDSNSHSFARAGDLDALVGSLVDTLADPTRLG